MRMARAAAILGVLTALTAAGGQDENLLVPRPVVAWPSGPMEVRFAFERPLDAALGVDIGYGRRDSPPFGRVTVVDARLDGDRRTLIVTTDPLPFQANYRAGLQPLTPFPADRALPIAPFDFTGVQAEFLPDGAGAKAESIWWPAIDTETVRIKTRGSAEHERFAARLRTPGRLTLRTMVTLPTGKGTLRLRSSHALVDPSIGGEPGEIKTVNGESLAAMIVNSTGEPLELITDVRTTAEGKGPSLLAVLTPGDDRTGRPLGSSELTLPWAPPKPANVSPAPPMPAQFAGGDATRGEAVFFSEAAKCSACHAIRGKGGAVGPDLSKLAEKTPAEVYRDIQEPSTVINAEFVPFSIQTKDGRVLVGIVRSEGKDALKVTGTDAKAALIKRSEIEEIRPSATSIMPVGLPGAIGEAKMKDLMAFLLDGKK